MAISSEFFRPSMYLKENILKSFLLKKHAFSNCSPYNRSFKTKFSVQCKSVDSSSFEEDKILSKKQDMKVKITYGDQSITVRKGIKLRTALLRNGLSPHNGNSQLINCRGLGTCGTCTVRIIGDVSPSDLTTAENLRMRIFPHNLSKENPLRFACQIRVESDITVTKMDGFWGQGENEQIMTNKSNFIPFGELEYIMDKDSSL